MAWKPEGAKNEYAHNRFVHECEFRLPVNTTPVCGVIGEMADVPVQIFPRTCAKCRINGQVNREFLRGEAYNVLLSKLRDAVLGLHDGSEHVLDMLDRLLTLSAEPAPERQRADVLEAAHLLLSLGRVSYTEVEPVFVKHGYDDPEHAARKMIKTAAALSANAPPQPVHLERPCAGCGGANVGLLDVAAYLVNGEADEAVVAKRKTACESCEATDSDGQRLYRPGKFSFCGLPWPMNIARDEQKEGCGCCLNYKWRGKTQKCPLGKWPE